VLGWEQVTAEQLSAAVLERTVELAEIPAPTGHEDARRERVRSWWQQDGWADVRADAVGNVWARVRPGDQPAVVLAAHLDTVLDAAVDHRVRREGTLLRGVGVGDDSVGVGSVRWQVTVSGPGGHAWERANAPSAVHASARMVAGLAALSRRGAGSGAGGRSAVNIGMFCGGEAVNARARRAVFLVDLRASRAKVLDELEVRARRITGAFQADITVEVEEMGRRPAGELAATHPLAAAAAAALRESGLKVTRTAASTDANAAHAAGVPAIAIGVTTGGAEHTPEEWIDTAPLATGLGCAADTIIRWEGVAQ
jgi:tripeptide aminopeptidase